MLLSIVFIHDGSISGHFWALMLLKVYFLALITDG